MSNINRKIIIEKITNKLYINDFPKKFPSFRSLCRFFDIPPPGGNQKDSLMDIYREFMDIEKADGGNSLIIKEVFKYQKARANHAFLDSDLYPPCTYLLLKYLEGKYNDNMEDEYIYLSSKKLSTIIGLANDRYLRFYEDQASDDDDNVTDAMRYINNEIITRISKATTRILLSARNKNFINFDYTICVNKDNKFREATDDEKDEVEKARAEVAKEYNLTSFNKAYGHKRRKEIFGKVNALVGYDCYDFMKFKINESLAGNKLNLEKLANITENTHELINKHYCGILLKYITRKTCERKNYNDVDEYINDFEKTGARVDRNYRLIYIDICLFQSILDQTIDSVIKIH